MHCFRCGDTPLQPFCAGLPALRRSPGCHLPRLLPSCQRSPPPRLLRPCHISGVSGGSNRERVHPHQFSRAQPFRAAPVSPGAETLPRSRHAIASVRFCRTSLAPQRLFQAWLPGLGAQGRCPHSVGCPSFAHHPRLSSGDFQLQFRWIEM